MRCLKFTDQHMWRIATTGMRTLVDTVDPQLLESGVCRDGRDERGGESQREQHGGTLGCRDYKAKTRTRVAQEPGATGCLAPRLLCPSLAQPGIVQHSAFPRYQCAVESADSEAEQADQ